jgi:hypothetical protein
MRLASVVMAGAALALVAGCAAQPMTRERAARLCADEAREADGISGTIGVGAGSEGGSASGRLVITSAILDPQSEADALEACIARRMAGGGDAPPRSGLTVALEGSF